MLTAEVFLSNGPPFAGDSEKAAKDVLKACGAKWDTKTKRWCAHDETILLRVMRTGTFRPLNVAVNEDLRIAPLIIGRAEAKAKAEADARRAEQAQRQRDEL